MPCYQSFIMIGLTNENFMILKIRKYVRRPVVLKGLKVPVLKLLEN